MSEGCIEIPLTKGYVAVVDACDLDLLDYRWYASLCHYGRLIYAARAIRVGNKQKMQFLHRVVLERTLQRSLAPGETCDHIDGNSLNNRRSNLRLASYAQNASNRRRFRNNTSGYKGVTWRKSQKKWQAWINVNRKRIFLGHFDTAEEAYAAYCTAAIKLHGKFARID